MTKKEALEKIKELQEFIELCDKEVGYKDDVIFLLSKEEYERHKSKIPYIKTWWWLRDRYGDSPTSVCRVDYGGYSLSDDASCAFGIRPCLKYHSLKSEMINSVWDNCFIWNEITWHIIDEEKEIAIARLPISFDYFDKETNDYENSYIRKYLQMWYDKEVQ